MTADLLSMWDNVLSLMTEGVDFDLLPMNSEPEEPSSPLGFYGDSDIAGGPPAPFLFANRGRVAVDGEDPVKEPLDECDCVDDSTEVAGGPPPLPSAAGGPPPPPGAAGGPPPPPSAAGGPPPPPPPGPPIPKTDPHVEAKQKINQLIQKIKGMNNKDQKKANGKNTESNDDTTALDYDDLDEEGKKWADFNARGHQLSGGGRAFIELAKKKREEIAQQLKKLKSSQEGDEVFTLEELESAAGILGTAGDWYQSGMKELRKSCSLYTEKLEKVVESLVEFFQLRKEISELPAQFQCDGEPHEVLAKTKAEFNKRHNRWGEVILSGAQVWRSNKFPVCDELLGRSRGYVCGLVVKFVEGSLEVADKVDTAKENFKASLTKERLRESIQLLKNAAAYFSLKHAQNGESQQNGHQTIDQDLLLKLTVKVAETYFQLGINQFEGYINKLGKQKICDHFQSILGLLKKVEDLVNGLPRDETDSNSCQFKGKASSGVITRLPESDSLKDTMSKSCHSLCGHVQKEAESYTRMPVKKDDESDNDKKREKTKEMVHWMSFYCKYNYQISTASGVLPPDHEKTTHTTVQIAFSFIKDNLKQYESFVHILDGKRIRTHFEPIMKVVSCLVSNLPTNGASSSKTLKSLPNSNVLITTVIRSCDRLVEHYQNHETFTIEHLQSDNEEVAGPLKKRKDEVTKWLAFGCEYFREMLSALGPDHSSRVMDAFSKFEGVVLNVHSVLETIKV